MTAWPLICVRRADEITSHSHRVLNGLTDHWEFIALLLRTESSQPYNGLVMRWFRRQRSPFTRDPGALPPGAAPAPPRTLVEVLGIGRTETANGVTLTLLSLERYREGDLVTFRLSSRRGLHLDYPSPELFIKVGPSGATATPRLSMAGGGGGGGGQELEFRHYFGFSPAMPDDAEDWVIEVTKIEWVSPYRSGERRVAKVDQGPWRFVIRP